MNRQKDKDNVNVIQKIEPWFSVVGNGVTVVAFLCPVVLLVCAALIGSLNNSTTRQNMPSADPIVTKNQQLRDDLLGLLGE